MLAEAETSRSGLLDFRTAAGLMQWRSRATVSSFEPEPEPEPVEAEQAELDLMVAQEAAARGVTVEQLYREMETEQPEPEPEPGLELELEPEPRDGSELQRESSARALANARRLLEPSSPWRSRLMTIDSLSNSASVAAAAALPPGLASVRPDDPIQLAFQKYDHDSDGLLTKEDVTNLLVAEFGHAQSEATDGLADGLLMEFGSDAHGGSTGICIDGAAFPLVWERLQQQEAAPSPEPAPAPKAAPAAPPAPPPPPTLPVPPAPTPPPPQAPTPAAQGKVPAAVPPPPPLPSAERKQGVPPPPGPPPQAVPPPPPPQTNGTASNGRTPGPPSGGGRGDLLSQIAAGAQLRSVKPPAAAPSPAPAPAAAAAPPGGGDLLSQIAAGAQARPSGTAALSSIDALLSQSRAAAAAKPAAKPQAAGPDQYGKPVDGAWVNAKVPPAVALDMFQEMAWKRRQKEAKAAWEASQ